MFNRYPGLCKQCGENVPANEGVLFASKHHRGRMLFHIECIKAYKLEQDANWKERGKDATVKSKV